MKSKLLIILIVVFTGWTYSQENTGKVSYVTSQHIYVRFEQANDLKTGDTVFINKAGNKVPLFVIESKSSLTCMGKPLNNMTVQVNSAVVGTNILKKDIFDKKENGSEQKDQPDNEQEKKQVNQKKSGYNQKIKGRVSITSYNAFSKEISSNYQKQRYIISNRIDHIAGSRFSSDAYVSFTQKAGEWDLVKANIFKALKIYNLSLKYNTGKQIEIWAGRSINPNLSNMGAVDGLQIQSKMNKFSMGAVAGFHPDYLDYSLNNDLFEYGGFIAYETKNNTGFIQGSLAFFEQKNKGEIDRRFLYFQHNNSLIKNISYFVSSEIELYGMVDSSLQNTLQLTSLYFSVRYRISRQFSTFFSYDNRRNVIYFETFKNFADQLLEEAVRQGIRFSVNYRPFKSMYTSLNAGYRVREGDINPSKTLRGYMTINRLPFINANITFSGNVVQTGMVDGKIWGIKISKDLLNGNLYANAGYRRVNYGFFNSDSELLQNIAEADLTWRIAKKFTLSLNYETSMDKTKNADISIDKPAMYHHLFVGLTKRF